MSEDERLALAEQRIKEAIDILEDVPEDKGGMTLSPTGASHIPIQRTRHSLYGALAFLHQDSRVVK